MGAAGLVSVHPHPDHLHRAGIPWENPFVESFNGRARDELFNIEEFTSLTEASIVVEAWRVEYNTWRPHSSLGGLTPAEFKQRWIEQINRMFIAGGTSIGVPSGQTKTTLMVVQCRKYIASYWLPE